MLGIDTRLISPVKSAFFQQEETGCVGVMSGCGLLNNPSLFANLGDVDAQTRIRLAGEYLEFAVQYRASHQQVVVVWRLCMRRPTIISLQVIKHLLTLLEKVLKTADPAIKSEIIALRGHDFQRLQVLLSTLVITDVH